MYSSSLSIVNNLRVLPFFCTGIMDVINPSVRPSMSPSNTRTVLYCTVLCFSLQGAINPSVWESVKDSSVCTSYSSFGRTIDGREPNKATDTKKTTILFSATNDTKPVYHSISLHYPINRCMIFYNQYTQ